ncbi:flavin-containing monooxygenase [Streptomyces albipurpureus]|uniref:NAD(P)/FAD-dependent oxidoreductase n=1 Tax=Streptomyces albipurpureus TaxID=2897419 RepID=A0ABT0UHI0_9ACTN|nr:NAD(P)/FAD-dependent oxidoreductase [Streptomyces sp. CWNU-1]MCM2387560.1 NAD(P)/FAD-dependent oxidoreductase [Streptomyces sp. CWNU-1]
MSQHRRSVAPETDSAALDAVIVGAGFAGLYMLHKLRGLGLRAVVLEAGDGVGGTWYWNRYPGARVDVEAMHYSYSFSTELEQEWEWQERYPAQPEILRYLGHVADRFELRRDIRLSTRVVAASYDEVTARWSVSTDRGDSYEARYCVMATGCLSSSRVPDIEGLEAFEGPRYHTAQWPHEGVDFTGQRVGVIGTGSSGIQSIPLIAEQAAELTVFQRTPNYSLPARNRPLDPAERDAVKHHYPRLRAEARNSPVGLPGLSRPTGGALAASEEERRARYTEQWEKGLLHGLVSTYTDILTDPDANRTVAEFVREKIRETVSDPATADLLCPTGHPFGTKRPALDTGYYATYNRDNVRLVDIRRAPITRINARGVVTAGAEYPVDALVFATGFDAMTGTLNAIDIRGRGGLALRDKWAGGPVTYLGLQSAGFPNLFLVAGPGSPSVLTNMVAAIEQHVEWIADCVDHVRQSGAVAIEALEDAEADWVGHVNEVSGAMLYSEADSWYLGANVPGKARVFMPYAGGLGAYRRRCDAVAATGYEGFVLSTSQAPERTRQEEQQQ